MFFLYTRAGHVIGRHSASMKKTWKAPTGLCCMGTANSIMQFWNAPSVSSQRKLYICLAHPVCSVYRQSCCYKQDLLLWFLPGQFWPLLFCRPFFQKRLCGEHTEVFTKGGDYIGDWGISSLKGRVGGGITSGSSGEQPLAIRPQQWLHSSRGYYVACRYNPQEILYQVQPNITLNNPAHATPFSGHRICLVEKRQSNWTGISDGKK